MTTPEEKPQLLYPVLRQLAAKVMLVEPHGEVKGGEWDLVQSTPLKLLVSASARTLCRRSITSTLFQFASNRCKNATLDQCVRMTELAVYKGGAKLYRRSMLTVGLDPLPSPYPLGESSLALL